MPSSQEVLAAAANAKKLGRTEDSKALLAEYDRILRIEAGLPETPVKGSNKDAGFFENVGAGLGAGAVTMAELVSLGGATLLEEEAELKARKKIQDTAEKFRPEGGDKDSLTYEIFSGVGGILSALPATGLAALSAKPLLAAGIVGSGLGVAAMAGEQSEMARESDATEEERNIAIRRAAPFGVFEALPMAKALKTIGFKRFGDALDNLTGKVDDGVIDGIKGRLKSAGATGIAEGTQEFSAAIYQNLVARGYDPGRELVDAGVIKEGYIGAGAGTIVQAIADVIGRRSKRPNTPDTVEELEEELLDTGDTGEIRLGERHSDETQEEFDARQQASVVARDDQQPDMFSDELDDAEIDALEVEQSKQRIKDRQDRARLEDDDEVTLDMMEAEETRELKEKEEAKDQEERDKQVDIEDVIAEEDADVKAKQTKEQVRAESDLETLDAKRKDEVAKKTDMGRRMVLNEVFDSNPETGSNISEMFKTRLQEAGYRNPEPTKGELFRIKRFLDLKDTPTQEIVDSNSDLSTLESQIKEKGDVGKQATRAPVTETTGDSIQGDTKVVGQRRADGTRDTGRPVEGGLADSVSDTGRPARRKRRKQPSLIRNVKQASIVEDSADTKKSAAPKSVIQTDDKGASAPQINRKSGKVVHRAAKNFVPSHSSLQQDLQAISRVSKTKGITRSPNKKKTDFDAATEYFSAFDNPQSALYHLTYELAESGTKSTKFADAYKTDDMQDVAPALGIKNARAARKWVNKNLSSETKKTLQFRQEELKDQIAQGAEQDIPQQQRNQEALVQQAETKKEPAKKTEAKKAPAKKAPAKKSEDKTEAKKAPAKKAPAKKAPAKKSKDKTEATVDTSKGKTFTAYHRTTAEPFAEFNETHRDERKSKHSYAGTEGIYFSPKSNDESTIAFGANEAEVELTINNPVPIKTFTSSFDKKKTTRAVIAITTEQDMPKMHTDDVYFEQDGELRAYDFEKKPKQKQLLKEGKLFVAFDPERIYLEPRSAMKKAGYDGIIVPEGLDIPAQIVILEPKQAKVKSFTHLPTNEDITPAKPKTKAKPKAVDTKEDPKTDAQRDLDANLFGTNAELSKALEAPITEKMNLLLLKGDIKGALLEVARQAKSPRLKSIARALADNIGNTKIEFLDGKEMETLVKQKVGKIKFDVVRGAFLHKENTIVFNTSAPLTIHTLLHESTHAAVDLVIHRNPSMPAVKFLKRLYNETKGDLGTAYGTENIFEFVAEAMSNPEFRARLASTRVGEANAFVTFMRHIANILRSLVGLDTKPVDKSEAVNLDIFDQTVKSIMAPTPDAITRLDLTPSLLTDSIRAHLNPEEKKPRDLIKWVADSIKNLDLGLGTFRKMLKIINLQSLSDLGKLDGVGLGDVGQQLLVDIENQQGLFEQYQKGVNKILKDYKAFLLKHGFKAQRVLNRIIYNQDYGATIYQVDPTKDRSDYEGKFVDGNSLEEIYDAQQKQLDSLPDDEARDAVLEQFTTMRNQYKKQWQRLRRALKLEFDSLAKESGDSTAINEVARKIDQALFAKGELEVYFPLVRQGKYRVSFKYNPENRPEALETGFLMFESKSERDAFIKDIPNIPNVLTGSAKAYNDSMSAKQVGDNAPSGSFVSEVLKVLDKGNVSNAIQDEIMRMYVEALPETAYARSLTGRLGQYGYIQSAKVAMESKGPALSMQAAKLESGAAIRATIRDIEEARKDANNEYADAVAKSLVSDHANFAMKGADYKDLEVYFKRANQIAFTYTLGFNVSSALVNLSQIPLVAIPMLVPRYGFNNAMAAWSKAMSMTGSASNSLLEYYDIKGDGLTATYVLREDLKKSIRANSTKAEADSRIEELTNLIPLIKMAHLRGKLPERMTLQEVGINERSGFLDKLSHLSAYAFGVAERFNTQTTLLLTYNLTLQEMNAVKARGGKYLNLVQAQEINISDLSEPELQNMAAEEAIYQTQEVNAGGRLETAAPLTKQNFFRVGLMYKGYGLQMYYTMFKSLFSAVGIAFKGNKAQRKIARQQIAGLHLSALLFAGVGGIPIYGLVSMIYDMFADEDEDTADEVVRKYVTELGFKGPLSEVLGADVAARVKLTDLLFQENRFMRDPAVEEMIGFYIGGPALSTGKRLLRGLEDFSEGNTYRGFEAISPGGLGNILQAGRFYADEGIRSRRGEYIYEDINGFEIASKLIGFAPLDYTFQVEQNARNKRVDIAVGQQRKDLASKYYIALRLRDWRRAEKLLDEMREFSYKHPGAAITGEYLRKSLAGHVKRSGEMTKGITVSPMMRYAIEVSNDEYKKW